MIIPAEALAAVLRRLLDKSEPVQADLEDVLVAERATEILAGEGFDPAKVFRHASEIAIAFRVVANSEAEAAQLAQTIQSAAIADVAYRSEQEVLL